MTRPKVLIADSISSRGIEELSRDGKLDAVVKTGLESARLIEIVPDFAGIIVRSETKITADVINAAKNLRVIGRAGVGVDNIDVEAATRRGVVVLNAPGGNTVSTAEHAFSLLLCVARKIPQADANVRSGKWNRTNFQGVELYDKTLGIIGMGRIGSELSRRAIAFGMRVVAYDPYLSAARARSLQVQLVDELDDLLSAADFISFHTPLTAETRHLLDRLAFCPKRDQQTGELPGGRLARHHLVHHLVRLVATERRALQKLFDRLRRCHGRGYWYAAGVAITSNASSIR